MTACSKNELEFSIFLINALAEHFGMQTPDIYRRLSISRILDEYIIPCYDALHTLGEEYLVNDISEMMRERGVLA